MALSQALGAAGLKAPVRPRLRDEIWVKLWGNLSFNPISALTLATLDVLCTDPGTRAVARAMMLEAQQIAEKLGVKFPIDVERRIDGGAAVGAHRTSMLQDLDAGRPMEIDALVGSVQELGRITDTPTPTIDTVLGLIRLRGAGRRALPVGRSYMVTTHDALEDPRNAYIRIYVNGALKHRDEAVVSVYDSGFMLGDGMWEGMRLYDGVWAFFDDHMDRFFDSCKTVSLDPGMDRKGIMDALEMTRHANGMETDVHCRLMLTRGGEGAAFPAPCAQPVRPDAGDHHGAFETGRPSAGAGHPGWPPCRRCVACR